MCTCQVLFDTLCRYYLVRWYFGILNRDGYRCDSFPGLCGLCLRRSGVKALQEQTPSPPGRKGQPQMAFWEERRGPSAPSLGEAGQGRAERLQRKKWANSERGPVSSYCPRVVETCGTLECQQHPAGTQRGAEHPVSLGPRSQGFRSWQSLPGRSLPWPQLACWPSQPRQVVDSMDR